MADSGNIQDQLLSLHVGGTNGKGSTSAILESLLHANGVKVGCYTGPHLLRWNERFHIDGQAIADDEFAELATRVRQSSEEFGQKYPDMGPLTWFEFLTVMAFTYFVENKVEAAILEVGLGGRYDATNVLSKPAATAITNVDLDHTQILGDTVNQIASEKAGIIKTGIPIVSAATGEALKEIQKVAQEKQAPIVVVPAKLSSMPWIEEVLDELKLIGSHQRINAMVALSVIDVARQDSRFAKLPAMTKQTAIVGLRNVYWPGRLQYLQDERLILDGAHNPAGAKALRQALDEKFVGNGRIFVLGFFANKDVEGWLTNLLRPTDFVITTEVAAKRQVMPAEQIARLVEHIGCSVLCVSDVGKALEIARSKRHDDQIVVATGSFYVVKECMLSLGWTSVEDGRQLMPIERT
ncbi:MAG: bifunctional folylpolyglutamate synthase/dihydrofolate synthase [Candidatus Obscuribacterales bacterium]|nr:bifunctional folylpolyglutamate synthase/dihydrofolate synthase [Candidatus Obscuribacterales bacterium]